MTVIAFPSFEIAVPPSADEVQALRARAPRGGRSPARELAAIVLQWLRRDRPPLQAQKPLGD